MIVNCKGLSVIMCHFFAIFFTCWLKYSKKEMIPKLLLQP